MYVIYREIEVINKDKTWTDRAYFVELLMGFALSMTTKKKEARQYITRGGALNDIKKYGIRNAKPVKI